MISFRGKPLATAKQHHDGTHRACSPQQTLEWITPVLRACGITRDADITGLDRVGIPVTLAVRPNARLIVGATGKGTTLLNARVSGLMEAIEVFHAEYADESPDAQPFLATYADLVAQNVSVAPVADLPLCRGATFRTDYRYSWTWGHDLLSGQEVPVPYLYVHLGRIFLPPVLSDPLASQFIGGSNGLASGNTLLEAICAALYEVIERDCMSVWVAAERDHGQLAPMVDPADLGPQAGELAQRIRDAGLRLAITDNTTDTNVPTYCALISDPEPGAVSAPASGWGTHLDPQVALVRAITEAAQSRAVLIAGSRDDIFRSDRNVLVDVSHVEHDVIATPRANLAGPTFEADLSTLLDRMRNVGVSRVVVVNLTRPDLGIPVVKLWVPGLEEYCRVTQYRTGERAANPLRHVEMTA